MTDKKHSPMTNSDDDERYVRIMQKLQTKHDDLFEKIVFAQREDKDDIAKSHACELVAVREMMKLDKHELFKKLNE
jgi:hypothetical protein